MESNNPSDRLSIVVIGASGDLSRRKIFPALFALYCQNLLPKDFHVFGFARSDLDQEEFQSRIVEYITCRYVPGESCQQRIDEFLKRCHYVQGEYDSRDSFLDLYQAMRVLECRQPTDRLFYLAIPPSIFVDVANSIGNAGLIDCGIGPAVVARRDRKAVWTRPSVVGRTGRGPRAGVFRGTDLSDRSLFGQGGHPEPTGATIREHGVRAVVESRVHRIGRGSVAGEPGARRTWRLL